ncbi:hypothetical protein THAOC_15119, partial [Thalassiosira oceanica]
MSSPATRRQGLPAARRFRSLVRKATIAARTRALGESIVSFVEFPSPHRLSTRRRGSFTNLSNPSPRIVRQRTNRTPRHAERSQVEKDYPRHDDVDRRRLDGLDAAARRGRRRVGPRRERLQPPQAPVRPGGSGPRPPDRGLAQRGRPHGPDGPGDGEDGHGAPPRGRRRSTAPVPPPPRRRRARRPTAGRRAATGSTPRSDEALSFKFKLSPSRDYSRG